VYQGGEGQISNGDSCQKQFDAFAALVRVKKAKNTKNKTNTLKLKDVVVKAIEDPWQSSIL